MAADKSKIPFNPFPITGENDQNQPSNRNIAPILNFSKGGLPDIAAGYKQRNAIRKSNRYTLQVANTAQNIDMLNNDINGETGYINLGKLLPAKSPFVFVPDIYSITLENISGVALDMTLSSWNVSFYDLQAGEYIFSVSPSNPTSEFVTLGFDIPLPILQYDDFVDIKDYLNFLNNLVILPGGAIFNNNAATRGLVVKQFLLFRMEQLT